MTKNEARFDRMVESFLRRTDMTMSTAKVVAGFISHLTAIYPAVANSTNEADIAFRDFLRGKLENLRAF